MPASKKSAGTGATSEQIKMAWTRATSAPVGTAYHAGYFEEAAKHLVSTDQRIVPLDLLKRIVERERDDRMYIGPFLSDEDYLAMCALVGG